MAVVPLPLVVVAVVPMAVVPVAVVLVAVVPIAIYWPPGDWSPVYMQRKREIGGVTANTQMEL